MTSSSASLMPVTQNERIDSLDILRGFVILGILLMNIVGFGLWGAYGDPTVSGGSEGLNLYIWIITTLFFEGTMRALLSLLFGVGMYILTSRIEKAGGGIKAADIYFRRTMWLIFFGLVHSYLLLWDGEILYAYGMIGLFIFSFRNMAPKKLVAIAIFLVICGSTWDYFDHRSNVKLVENVAIARQYTATGKELTKELKNASAKWEKIQYERSPEHISEVNEQMHRGYFSIVAFLAPFNMDTDTFEQYRYAVWDAMSMMLLGIALFRWKVLTAERPLTFYIVMALIAYAIGLAVNYYELQEILNSNFAFLGFSRAHVTYHIGRLFTAIGHLGVIMVFCKLPILTWLKTSLAAVGKMALSNYLLDSIICMIIFKGFGFGMFGKLQRYELYYIVLAIWILQLVASPIWLSYFRFGPAEWLWRSLTYMKLQPMKKNVHAVIPVTVIEG